MSKTGYKACQRGSEFRREEDSGPSIATKNGGQRNLNSRNYSGTVRKNLDTPQAQRNYFDDPEVIDITTSEGFTRILAREFSRALSKRGRSIGKRAPFIWKKST